MSFANEIFIVTIPNYVQEVLLDLRWKATINNEIKSIEEKIKTWDLGILQSYPLKGSSIL